MLVGQKVGRFVLDMAELGWELKAQYNTEPHLPTATQYIYPRPHPQPHEFVEAAQK